MKSLTKGITSGVESGKGRAAVRLVVNPRSLVRRERDWRELRDVG